MKNMKNKINNERILRRALIAATKELSKLWKITPQGVSVRIQRTILKCEKALMRNN
jgi:hypothetical protein